MPFIEVHLIEGADVGSHETLSRALIETARQIIPAAPDEIIVKIRNVAAENSVRNGEPPSAAHPPNEPIETVRSYLAAMEARDLQTAKGLLAPGFEMVFPGGRRMTTLEELIDWSAPRYRFVRKTYASWDQGQQADRAIVHCHGTLSGEWPDGTPFAGIRFIDRFELEASKIARQDVWNDIGEVRRASAEDTGV